ncbi:E3 ubiquitin-protein ligase SIRP1-like isoform X2 [Typha latifolia]|uniref:E3 ubiquitin-protein ligase SIRP1-like isoform X2 n=1 Tax=Typha latifolia TaxID=4733 RepID=UPI003C30E0D9
MGEALATRYWCHVCAQVVNPMMEREIKCPFCDGGFVEEMDGRNFETAADVRSERSLSLWAPILLGMMGDSSRPSRLRREEDDEDSDHEFEDFIRRRRSSAILRLLQSIRNDVRLDPDSRENERERERERERDREGASLGDYFLGPGLELLLQHLAENDPNRYGTPPAKKEAVDALPNVKIEEALSCSVCLDDFDIGMDTKEMPCKHKFHSGCILPWLELHSSCPVCRFQLPADEKTSNDSNSVNGVENSDGDSGDVGDSRGNNSRSWVPVPWPFNGLFSLSGSQNNGNSNPSSSSSSASGSNSHAQGN